MDIGSRLREAREQRGLTLQDIAKSTRLSVTTLRQIEENQLDRLPGGILTRGFLRAFAAEVGPEAKQAVDRFLDQAAAAVKPPPPPKAGLDRAAWRAVTVAAMLTLAGAYLVRWSLLPASDAPSVIESAMPIEAPSASPIAVRSEPVLAAQNTEVVVEIEPIGPCWVTATADGESVLDRRLDAGDRVTLEAGQQLVIRVGDPRMFVYTVNGRPGRPLGRSVRPITVEISIDNHLEFRARPGRGSS